MTILTERKTWSRQRPQNETRHSSDLTPEEQTNARAALRFLRAKLGGIEKLSAAMQAKPVTVAMALRRNLTAGIALRVARAAGVPLEEILAGHYPAPGACPHCGRSDPAT